MDLRTSSLKVFFAKVANAGVVFVGITIFARMLLPAQLGAFFLFEALLGLLAIPADFGLRGAAEKRISEGRTPHDVFATVIVLKFLPIILVAFAVVVFRTTLNRYVGAPVAILLVIALFLNEYGRLMMRVVAGELRVGETAVLQFVRYFTWLIVGFILVRGGFGTLGLVYGLIAGLVAMLLWGSYKQSFKFGSISYETARSLLSYSQFNFVSHVGGYLYSWMDIAFIGFFVGAAAVGAYEVAWRVATLVTLLSSSIGATVFPQLSQWSAENAVERIESLIPEALTPSLVFVIPSFFGVLLFSSEILSLLFGPEYAIATTVLIVLMGEKVFQAVHTILGRSLQGIDRPDLAARAATVTIVMNIVLNGVLVWRFGILGAAVATTVSFLVNTFLHARYLSRFLTIRANYLEIGWCVIAALGMTAVLIVLQSVVPVQNLPILAMVVLIGAVTYGMLVLVYPPLRMKAGDYARSLVQGVAD